MSILKKILLTVAGVATIGTVVIGTAVIIKRRKERGL
jgi:hypothetical protein